MSSLEDIEHILHDVKPENAFWLNNGPVVRNIYELVQALQQVDKSVFSYHVNYTKNDISNWIKNMLKDPLLADDLLKTKDKEKTIKKIKKRISQIEKELEKNEMHLIVSTKTVHDKQLDFERVFLELIITFILGLIVGLAIGIIIEHYGIVPTNWF
jgi:F0F1-type ATP synthase assembly protein I